MSSRNLTHTLAEHGLVKADTATESDWNTVNNLRSRFSMPLTWENIQRILNDYPQTRPYLYLSTGMDGLVLLNVGTGETVSAQPLVFALFSEGDNSGDWLDMPVKLIGQQLERWDNTPSIASLIQQGEINEARQRIEHATALAPTALAELVYSLMPWEELGDGQFQRRIALTVRKNEEYPSQQFDENLVELLKQTTPCTDGEEPLEMVVDKPITVYRGEIDKSVHMGLSWTSSLEVAKKFAGRFGRQGTIWKTVLEPEKILAAYADDGEHEVLAIVSGDTVNTVRYHL
jgi:hypothetical protein